ncbi:MAG TPA: cysteine methyltransferase [Candidatus Wallbacteria bacterium]|nr:cysteine methyltransferase [Candidatus Wallbacteria bacterium]
MEYEYIVFNGPPFKIYCDFEDGLLVKVSIRGSGLAKVRRHEYTMDPGHPFMKELADYFAGRLKKFRQKIRFKTGTEFQRLVWKVLAEIKCGDVFTYKELSEKIGKPEAARAVGNALGKNPLPLVIPCHRVIRSDGSLGGFTGGTDIKKTLLEIEGVKLN